MTRRDAALVSALAGVLGVVAATLAYLGGFGSDREGAVERARERE